MGAELAGRLQQRIRFEARLPGADGAGGIGNGWVTAAEVWGEIRPADRAALSAAAADTRITARRWRIVVRRGLPIRLDMRVRWRGLVMRLTGIQEDPGQPDRVTLSAEELGPAD